MGERRADKGLGCSKSLAIRERMVRRDSSVAPLWIVLLAGMVLLPGQAVAATFAVTSSGDTGDTSPGDGVCAATGGGCTLRAAIGEANALPGSDLINLPAMTIPLGSELLINSQMTLVGAGAGSTVIDGSGRSRVFQVDGAQVEFRALQVRGGFAQGGGGFLVQGASVVEINDARIAQNTGFTGGGGMWVGAGARVTVQRTAIESNTATGAFGGGINNSGTLLLHESLVAGNSSNRAGAIRNNSAGVLVLRNTTVSGNIADSPRAGTGGINNVGFAVLDNVTITGNRGIGTDPASFLGGGVQSFASATLVVRNSIIAGNDGRGGPNDCAGPISFTSTHVLLGDANGCQLPPVIEPFLIGVNPQLGPLANNGGPTRTHLPASTSPVKDAGNPSPTGGSISDSCPATDQRGVTRLLCDLGAVEIEVPVPTQIVVDTTDDQVDALPGDATCATAFGACSLRAAVQEANRLPGHQEIIVPAGAYGLLIPPTSDEETGLDPAAGGDLDLRDNVTVAGVNRATVSVNGNGHSRIFDVAHEVTATVRGMTLRNGNDAGGGAIRAFSASLTLRDAIVEGNESAWIGGGIMVEGFDSSLSAHNVIIRNNRAPFFGGHGGGIHATGQLTLDICTITGNQASGQGGGVDGGDVTVARSTIASNRAPFGSGGGIMAVRLDLRESTVSGNTSSAPGGGVFASTGTIVNSTISGNTSSDSGGGVSTNGSLSLLHATIANNRATGGGTGLLRFGSGSSLSVWNTILANPSGPECAGLPPASQGNNIASDTSCNLRASGDRQSTNARLGSLRNNGGRSLTHLPAAGSPAINAAARTGLMNDQRGMRRPRGARPDIGAVER
ncbi:MAG: CSLREA domain-containing protein [Myxococcaceae bacterium]|nr:CSLREA domain-containing protein [Myxococcaceae bacterium]